MARASNSRKITRRGRAEELELFEPAMGAGVRRARKKLGLSQDQFAGAFGVSASTLRKWEQGQRSPTGAAKVLLRLIERDPHAVLKALS